MKKPLETTPIDGSAKAMTVQPVKGSNSRSAKPANFPPRTQAKPDERLPIKERPKGM